MVHAALSGRNPGAGFTTIRAIAPSRDRQILAAAQKLFFDRGFHAVGIDEIGERAGITGPAIYRHFKGKDEILGTLFDEALDGLLAAASAEGFERDAPLDELRFLSRAHAEFVVSNRELAIILVRDNSSLAREYRRRHQRRERPYISRWISGATRAFPERTDAEATAAVFGALTVLNSIGGWPVAARQVEDLPGLLGDLAFGCVTALGASSP